MIKLISANEYELPLIHRMQKEAFRVFYEKYQDDETSPYKEAMTTMKEKFYREENHYFFLVMDNVKIGFVRIVLDSEKKEGRIAPIAIRPTYENNGYGSECLLQIENYFNRIKIWSLSTILQETKLIHFYEKNGYRQLKTFENINENMDIVYLVKVL